MTDRARLIGSTLAAIVAVALVAACSGGTAPAASVTPAASVAALPSSEPPPASTSPSADPSIAASAGPVPASPEPTPGVALTQPWATAELTDVATGKTFRIADLAGKVVFIETMAIWCSKCREQQADALTALGELGDAKVAYVVLDTDPGESSRDLAAYEKKRGWDAFTYAISPEAVSLALAEQFGDFVLNPPSTPVIVIGTDGTVTLTDFGHKSVDDLIALARQHGA